MGQPKLPRRSFCVLVASSLVNLSARLTITQHHPDLIATSLNN